MSCRVAIETAGAKVLLVGIKAGATTKKLKFDQTVPEFQCQSQMLEENLFLYIIVRMEGSHQVNRLTSDRIYRLNHLTLTTPRSGVLLSSQINVPLSLTLMVIHLLPRETHLFSHKISGHLCKPPHEATNLVVFFNS